MTYGKVRDHGEGDGMRHIFLHEAGGALMATPPLGAAVFARKKVVNLSFYIAVGNLSLVAIVG